MPVLSALIDSRLAQLPRSLSLEWPGGRLGAGTADVHLRLAHRSALTWLMSGHIGTLADAYVRGDLEIEGRLSDVMAVAAALVGDPVRRDHMARGRRAD